MSYASKRLKSAALVPLALLATSVAAAEDKNPEDLYYLGLLGTTLNHRTIGPYDENTWSAAGTLVAGGRLTDMFHAEFRAGKGLSEGNVTPDYTLTIDYFASWYIGMRYPLTEYTNVYGQFGFSYISGSAELTNADEDQNKAYKNNVGDYPDSGFSASWVAGLDLELIKNTYLVVEGGRLFKDTGTRANTFQFSSGLRYEF